MVLIKIVKHDTSWNKCRRFGDSESLSNKAIIGGIPPSDGFGSAPYLYI